MMLQWLALVCDLSHTFVVVSRPGTTDTCDEVISGYRARMTYVELGEGCQVDGKRSTRGSTSWARTTVVEESLTA